MTTRIGPYPINTVIHGHALELARKLPDNSIHVTITSPPYFGHRDYNLPPVYWPAVIFRPMVGLPEITIPEQVCCLGLEGDIWSYVGHLVAVFREVKRTLRDDGTFWLNLGDSFAGNRTGSQGKGLSTLQGGKRNQIESGKRPDKKQLPDKNLLGIPWRVAFALQADGWFLRADIPWVKRNGMPGSQQDRPTTSKEYWFLLSKSERYYFDQEAVKMPPADYTRKGGKAPYTANGSATHGVGSKSLHQMSESGRYRRDSDWFFDSLRVILEDNAQMLLTDEEGEPLALSVNPKGYSKAHFATFPPALVTPMILASTSERGHCPECGNPWKRVIEKVKDSLPVKERHGRTGHNGQPPQISGNYWTGPTTKATGQWQPTCNCEGSISPAIVLDPFFGSGTVGQVAAKNRRHYLGFELNEDYLELAPDRVTTQVRMF